MVDNQPTLRDRLGGRWAISLRAYLWSAAPWILVGALSEPLALTSFQTFSHWLGISIVAYLAMGAVFFTAHKSVMRNRTETPVPLWVALGVIITASLVRSITFAKLIDATGLQNHVALELRLVTAVLMAITAFPVLTLAFDSWDRFVQERNRLVNEAVTEQVHFLQQQQALEVVRLGIIKELQLRVSRTMSSARNDITEISDASALEHIGPDVVQIFRDISRGSIRKISHDLRRETEQVNKFSWADIVSTIAHSRPYRPFLIIPPLFALSITVIARNESFINAVRLAWLWSLPALAITLLTNWYCKKYDQYEIAIYIASIVSLAALGFIPFVFFLEIGSPISEALAWGIMGTFMSACIIPVSGIGDGLSLHRKSVLDSLRTQVQEADVAQLALQRERNSITNEIATYMHGTVQANLSASIMRLSQALANGNKAEAVEAFNQARAALELPEEFDFDQKSISLQQHLENLQANWNGLTTITAQVVGDNLNPVENRVLQTISTEAINNAVRHGNASHIDLTITVEPDVISIIARNDGTLHANEKRGMGLATLDQYSRNDWSLTTDENGNVLLQARIKRA